MEQRLCEVCSDPLSEDVVGAMCDACVEGINTDIGFIDEEILECEIPADVVVPSSSVMPELTTPAPGQDRNTSKSSDVSSAVDATEWDDLDFPMPAPSPQMDPVVEEPSKEQILQVLNPEMPSIALPEVVEAIEAAKAPTTACEACGFLQHHLHVVKTPNMREPILMCDTCFAGEMALVHEAEDPMQGKIVHPDEADRAEVLTMDNDDRILYNDEVLINASTTIEEVEARVSLLTRRLHRAKLQLKASRTVLLMRVESMKKEEKDKYYREAGIRLGQQKRKVQGDATQVKKVSPQARRSKAQQYRDNMRSNGFPDTWIDDQLKKMGWE